MHNQIFNFTNSFIQFCEYDIHFPRKQYSTVNYKSTIPTLVARENYALTVGDCRFDNTKPNQQGCIKQDDGNPSKNFLFQRNEFLDNSDKIISEESFGCLNRTNNITTTSKDIKMSQVRLNNQSEAVASSKASSMAQYYKPSRNYDESTDFQVPDVFLSKNGKFDTSKRYWGLKTNQWRSNRHFTNYHREKNPTLNQKGSMQGDHKIYKSNQLPDFVRQIKAVKETHEEEEKGFWSKNFDENPSDWINEVNGLPIYFPYLKDEIQLAYYLKSYDMLTDINSLFWDFDEVYDEIRDQVTDLKTISVIDSYPKTLDNMEKFYKSLSGAEQECCTPSNFLYLHQLMMQKYGKKQTQTFEWILYNIASPVTAIATTAGYFALGKLLNDANKTITNTKNLVSNVSSEIWDFIKQNLDQLAIVAFIISSVIHGSLNFQALKSITLVWLSTKFFGPATTIIISVLMTLLFPSGDSSQQLTIRRTQALDNSNVVISCISIVSMILFGISSDGTICRKVAESLKLVTSISLVTSRVDQIFAHIVLNLPEIVKSFLYYTFPAYAKHVLVIEDEEFRKLLKNLSLLQACKLDEILYNSHMLNKFLLTYNAFRAKVLDLEDPTDFSYLFKDEFKFLDDIYKQAKEHHLLPGQRLRPVVVWIAGDSGVGKSLFVKELARNIMKSVSPDKEFIYEANVYNYNTSNKFFDNYHNQPIFVLNDYLQFTTEEEEKLLIKLVDTNDLMLEVSSVDNEQQGIKGEVRFTSKIIIITSNVAILQQSSNIVSLEAFNRRRDLVYWFKMKPNSSIVFDDMNYSWADIKQYDPLTNRLITNDILIPNIVRQTVVILENYIGIHLKLNHDFKIAPLSRAQVIKDSFNQIFNYYISEGMRILETFFADGYSFMGISMKVIVGMLAVGSASFILFKTLASSALEKHIQAFPSSDVSTSKMKIRRKDISKKAMSIDDNALMVIEAVKKNLVRIFTSVPLRDGRTSMFSTAALFIADSYILTPKHAWYRGDLMIDESCTFRVQMDNVVKLIYFNINNYSEHETKDLAIYNLRSDFPAQHKRLDHLFIKDDFKVPEHVLDAFLVMNSTTTNQNYPMGLKTKYDTDEAYYYDAYEAEYIGKNWWTYVFKTKEGDCGSPLIISDSSFINKIVGIHTAGDNYEGNSTMVTQFDICQMLKKFPVVRNVSELKLTESDEHFLKENFTYLGNLEKSTTPFQISKTDIVISPLNGMLMESITAPAVLSPFDDRLNMEERGISIIGKSVAKFGKLSDPFDPFLLEQAFFIVKDLYRDQEKEIYRTDRDWVDIVSASDMPNLKPFDMTTSPGYPHTILGLKKNKLFKVDDKFGRHEMLPYLRERVERFERELLASIDPDFYVLANLKDERVKLEKIPIGKTRCFMIFPIEITLIMRKYFDSFINAEMKNRIYNGSTPGINPYSLEWDRLYTYLNVHPNAIDGDYSGFDSKMQAVFFQYYARLVNSFYKDQFSDLRNYLMYLQVYNKIIVMNQVYLRYQGNPSGARTTISLNNFVNKMYIVMSYLHATPIQYASIRMFRENVRLVTHGDDHIITYSDNVKSFFNGISLSHFMKMHGIEYTTADKTVQVESKKLQECTYLKNNFVFDQDLKIFKAGLNKNVIEEMCNWTRGSTEGQVMEICQANCGTTLRFAYFHGKNYFDTIRTKMLKFIVKKGFDLNLLDYYELASEFDQRGELTFDDDIVPKDENYTLKSGESFYKTMKMEKLLNQKKIVENFRNLKVQAGDILNEPAEPLRSAENVIPVFEGSGSAYTAQNLYENVSSNVPVESEQEIIDDMNEFSISYASILSKPFNMPLYSWSTSAIIGTILTPTGATGTYPLDYFNLTKQASSIRDSFKYIRGTLCLTFSLASQPLCSGGVIISPLWRVGDFDSITSCYQRQHIILDASDNSSTQTLEIPFRYHRNMVDTLGVDWFKISMIVIAPLVTGGSATSLQVSVTAHWKDPRIHVLRTQSLQLFGTTNVINNYDRIVNSVLPSNVVGDAYDISVKASAMDDPINTLNPTNVWQRYPTLNNAANVTQMERLALMPKGVNTSTFDTFGTRDDEMSLDFLRTREQLHVIQGIPLNTPVGQRVQVGWLGPNHYIAENPDDLSSYFPISNMDYISNFATSWRGSIKYKFRFFTNRFQSLKAYFGIFYDQEAPVSFDDFSSSHGVIMDIGGTQTQFEIEIPYVSTTPYKHVGTASADNPEEVFDCYLGQWAIYIMSPSISGSGTGNTVYYNLTYTYGDDFELRNFSNNNNWSSAQAGIIKLSDDKAKSMNTMDFLTDRIISLRDICKSYSSAAYSAHSDNSLTSLATDYSMCVPVISLLYATGNISSDSGTIGHYMCETSVFGNDKKELIGCYKGFHGSIKVRAYITASIIGTSTNLDGSTTGNIIMPFDVRFYYCNSNWPQSSTIQDMCYWMTNSIDIEFSNGNLGLYKVDMVDGVNIVEIDIPYNYIEKYIQTDIHKNPGVLLVRITPRHPSGLIETTYSIDFTTEWFVKFGDDARLGIFTRPMSQMKPSSTSSFGFGQQWGGSNIIPS